MITTHRHASSLAVILFVCALVSGCTTTDKITMTGPGAGVASGASGDKVSAATRVLVLAPKVVFEDAVTEALLDPMAHGGPGISNAMVAEAILTLRAKGLPKTERVSDGSLSEEQRAMALQLTELTSRVIRGTPDPEAMRLVQGLMTGNESVAVLAQYVRVKVGPAGTWDPNTGAITSQASSSNFRAVLIDCETGRRLWENSVLLRKLPDPKSNEFGKTLPLLYSTMNSNNQSKQ